MANFQKDKGAYLNKREELDINIGEYLLKLKRRWVPAFAVFVFTVGTTAFLSSFLEKTYKSEGKILFKKNPVGSLVDIGEDTNQFSSLLNDQTPLSTEELRITSQPVLQQTIDQLKLEDEEGNPLNTKELEKRLNVEIVGGTDVISLSYRDQDPVTASKVVNALMDIYIKEQAISNQSATVNADSFITNTIPKIEGKLQSLESRLQDFYEKNQVVDLKEEKRILVTELGNLNRQISSVGADLQGKKAQTSSLQNQLGLDLKQAIAANQLGSTPQVQSILEQLGATETQLSQERQRFKDNHPAVASLNEKKENLNAQLQQLIRQYVGAQVSEGLLQSGNLKENQLEKFIGLKIEELSLQTELASLYQYQQVYLDRAKDIPRLEKQEQSLLREVDSARSTYSTLLGNKQELELLINQQTGNAEVIELGKVPEEGSTGRMALMALGVLMGLFLSNLTAILLEMQDRTLKTIPEVKQKFTYQVLGIIPLDSLQDSQRGIVVQREPDSFASEIYRMIQTNLKFLSIKRQPKVILMTSSVPGEGKSTVTANLAAAMAQLGRKVMIIDGDLRKASQHELWQVSNRAGVKDIVAHKKSISQVVVQPMKQLDLLTSGTIAPNPLALLDSLEMSELVAMARKEYDLVVIDAPPLSVTADVLTLSKLADGILFVTRPGIVETESAELAQETITNANLSQKVLGMVINGVKPNEFDRYSYHAKYSKNYFSKPSESTHSKTATA
ncbi:polysaccharide biosynthesis tyrosine autokinase [Pleurocapsa sp. PCC 7319]|uniref:GumC family protein n=1 Tax=Pleurocapsa sp. PCC 7319 TaxID=118161 RepID=UPI0003491EEE|nr:polysaccharide biosynthesis tyrosine autokinase [Pleurocapsa sp. PCC 7319]